MIHFTVYCEKMSSDNHILFLGNLNKNYKNVQTGRCRDKETNGPNPEIWLYLRCYSSSRSNLVHLLRFLPSPSVGYSTLKSQFFQVVWPYHGNILKCKFICCLTLLSTLDVLLKVMHRAEAEWLLTQFRYFLTIFTILDIFLYPKKHIINNKAHTWDWPTT